MRNVQRLVAVCVAVIVMCSNRKAISEEAKRIAVVCSDSYVVQRWVSDFQFATYAGCKLSSTRVLWAKYAELYQFAETCTAGKRLESVKSFYTVLSVPIVSITMICSFDSPTRRLMAAIKSTRVDFNTASLAIAALDSLGWNQR